MPCHTLLPQTSKNSRENPLYVTRIYRVGDDILCDTINKECFKCKGVHLSDFFSLKELKKFRHQLPEDYPYRPNDVTSIQRESITALRNEVGKLIEQIDDSVMLDLGEIDARIMHEHQFGPNKFIKVYDIYNLRTGSDVQTCFEYSIFDKETRQHEESNCHLLFDENFFNIRWSQIILQEIVDRLNNKLYLKIDKEIRNHIGDLARNPDFPENHMTHQKKQTMKIRI